MYLPPSAAKFIRHGANPPAGKAGPPRPVGVAHTGIGRGQVSALVFRRNSRYFERDEMEKGEVRVFQPPPIFLGIGGGILKK
jgi:hypothetical protein